MATSSFERKFYVATENIDAFIKDVTENPPKNKKITFASRMMSAKELCEFLVFGMKGMPNTYNIKCEVMQNGRFGKI